MIKQSIVSTNFRNYCAILFCFTLLSAGLIFNVTSARTQTLLTTIPIGPEAGSGFAPSQVVANPFTNLVYISNQINDSISVVDGKSNKVIDNFKAEKIVSMVINSKTNRIYVVTRNGVNVIDGDTNDIITTIPAGERQGWPIVVNSTTNFIYMIDRDRWGICVIDGETNKIVDTIKVDNEISIVYMGINSVTNRIYGVCSDDNLMVIDAVTNSIVEIINVGGHLSKVAVNSSTNRIYVQRNSYKTKNSIMLVIDGKTNRVVGEIKLESFVNSIAVNRNTNKIYATVRAKSGIVNIIDGDSNQVVDVVAVGSSPAGVAVNAITNTVYVANNEDDSLSVIDGESNTIRDTVQIGETLYGGIGINYSTYRIYVGGLSSKSIFVIDGITNKVIDVIKVAVSPDGVPMGVGVNPVTNLIYVPIIEDGIVAVIDGSTNKVVENIKVSSSLEYGGIGVNPMTNRIYLVSQQGVDVIDGNTNSVIDLIGGIKPAFGIAVNSATNLIYVLQSPNSINVIDGRVNRVINNVRMQNFLNIMGIAVNSITNRIYLGSSTAGDRLQRNAESIPKVALGLPRARMKTAVLVVNGETLEVQESLDSPTFHLFPVIGVNPTTNHIYVADSSNISVIDGAKNKVIGTVEVEDGMKHGISINPLNNLIYITNAETGNVIVIKDDLE